MRHGTRTLRADDIFAQIHMRWAISYKWMRHGTHSEEACASNTDDGTRVQTGHWHIWTCMGHVTHEMNGYATHASRNPTPRVGGLILATWLRKIYCCRVERKKWTFVNNRYNKTLSLPLSLYVDLSLSLPLSLSIYVHTHTLTHIHLLYVWMCEYIHTSWCKDLGGSWSLSAVDPGITCINAYEYI